MPKSLYLLIPLALSLCSCGSVETLDNTLAEIKAAGHPITVNEIVPAKVADADNGAADYIKAFIRISTSDKPFSLTKTDNKSTGALHPDVEGVLRISRQENLIPGDIEKAKAFFGGKIWQDCRKHLRAGASRKSYRMDLEYQNGIEMLLPHAQYFLRINKLLVFESRLLDLEKKNSFETLALALDICRHLYSEPVLLTQLVRVSNQNLVLKQLDKLKSLSIENLEKLAGKVDARQSRRAMKNSFHGERIITTEWLRGIFIDGNRDKGEILNLLGVPGTPQNRIRLAFWGKGRFAEDIAYYNQQMIMYDGQFKNYTEDSKMEKIPGEHVISSMIVPALGGVIKIQAALEARLHVIKAGLALLKHQNSKGGFPETLAELKLPAECRDPFNNRKLSYLKSDKAISIYSIGKNRKDEKGEKDDIRFRVTLK